MPYTTAEDVLEGLERLMAAVVLPAGGPAPAPVFRGPDEAGLNQRDADRVFTAIPISDKRGTSQDKRSGGSCYRVLVVSIGVQYHRNKLTRRKMLADAPEFENALRHAAAGLAALASPVTGVHRARLLDGPRFDMTLETKMMTVFVVETEYHVEA